MADFESKLFRAIASGPNPTGSRVEPRCWTATQIKQLEKSKDALYEIVMLRAARLLEVTYQDEVPEQHKRVTQVSLTITISSQASDRPANGPGATAHAKPHPRIDKPQNMTQDAGIEVDVSYLDDDAIEAARSRIKIIGLVCPDKA